jgi:hypothetical protein
MLAHDQPDPALQHADAALVIHRETGHQPGQTRAALVAAHARRRLNDA